MTGGVVGEATGGFVGAATGDEVTGGVVGGVTGVLTGTATGTATGGVTGGVTGGDIGAVIGGKGVAIVHCPFASEVQPALQPSWWKERVSLKCFIIKVELLTPVNTKSGLCHISCAIKVSVLNHTAGI